MHDKDLGKVDDWDGYLAVDLSKVPLKTTNDFLDKTDFQKAVAASRVSTPKKFVAQTMTFYLHFCSSLLRGAFCHSQLVRGLSSFDPGVLMHSPETIYTESIQLLVNAFKSSGWITAPETTLVVSQYRSFVTKIRADSTLVPIDPVGFLSTNWELQSRAALYKVFRRACLCIGWRKPNYPVVSIELPEVSMSADCRNSLVSCLQLSLGSFANLTELFISSNSLDNLQSLLDIRSEISSDSTYSFWNVLQTSRVDRLKIVKQLERLYLRARTTVHQRC